MPCTQGRRTTLKGNLLDGRFLGSYDFDECPLNGANNVQLVEKRQQEVAKYYFAVADLSTKTSALQSFLYSDTKETSRHQETKVQSKDAILGDFNDISTDLNRIFDNHVPLDLSNDLYCACTDATQQCNLQGMPAYSCNPEEKAGAYLEKFEDSVAKYSAANDKGSSDCHAPQISINQAIKLKP
jgi:hypothetical protein